MGDKYNLNYDIYLPSSLNKAIEDYSPYSHIDLRQVDNKNVEIIISIKPAYGRNAYQIKNDFLNYLLDLTVKERFSGAMNV